VVDSALEAIRGVPASMLAPARKASEAAKRFSGNLLVSRAGLVDVNLPSSASPQGDEQPLLQGEVGIAETLVPFPEQPIAVGARWTVVRSYDYLGVRVRELTVYEVLKMDAQGIEFDGLVSASAAPGPIEQIDLPPEHTLYLTRLFVLGNVRGKVSFAHPVPTQTFKGTMKWSVRMRHVDDIVAEGRIVMETEREVRPELVPSPPASASAPVASESGK
jgi:hypothetical protein